MIFNMQSGMVFHLSHVSSSFYRINKLFYRCTLKTNSFYQYHVKHIGPICIDEMIRPWELYNIPVAYLTDIAASFKGPYADHILTPRAQPEVVYFLISNENPYFSNCKSKISSCKFFVVWRHNKKCEIKWYTRK